MWCIGHYCTVPQLPIIRQFPSVPNKFRIAQADPPQTDFENTMFRNTFLNWHRFLLVQKTSQEVGYINSPQPA
ncbi:hypothetical protein CCP4SC76_1550013 [Gammaproteobacteria bacterium]